MYPGDGCIKQPIYPVGGRSKKALPRGGVSQSRRARGQPFVMFLKGNHWIPDYRSLLPVFHNCIIIDRASLTPCLWRTAVRIYGYYDVNRRTCRGHDRPFKGFVQLYAEVLGVDIQVQAVWRAGFTETGG